jgi:hypothetical protein
MPSPWPGPPRPSGSGSAAAPLDFLGSFVGDPEGSSRAHLKGVADRAFAEGRALSVDDAMALAIGVT